MLLELSIPVHPDIQIIELRSGGIEAFKTFGKPEMELEGEVLVFYRQAMAVILMDRDKAAAIDRPPLKGYIHFHGHTLKGTG